MTIFPSNIHFLGSRDRSPSTGQAFSSFPWIHISLQFYICRTYFLLAEIMVSENVFAILLTALQRT